MLTRKTAEAENNNRNGKKKEEAKKKKGALRHEVASKVGKREVVVPRPGAKYKAGGKGYFE